jgi:hypothetical protein
MKILGTNLTYNNVNATSVGTTANSVVIRDASAAIIANVLKADTIGSRTGDTTSTKNITVNGNLIGSGYTISGFGTSVSDMRLKEVTSNITNATSKVCLLTPFKYKHSKLALEMYDNKDRINDTDRYGLSAQELQVVFPEVVSDKFIKDVHGNKYLSVGYTELIPVLVQCVKELNDRIAVLEGALIAK